MTKYNKMLTDKYMALFFKISFLLLFIITLSGCASNASLGMIPQTESVRAYNFNPKTIDKLAVLVQENKINYIPQGINRMIEDEFILVMLNKGYSVASRTDIEAIGKELEFQRSGMTDSDAAKLGKLLNVPAVLLVSVTTYSVEKTNNPSLGTRVMTLYKKDKIYYDTNAGISARLISVEKGEILWLSKHMKTTTSIEQQGEGNVLLKHVAQVVAERFPKHQ